MYEKLIKDLRYCVDGDNRLSHSGSASSSSGGRKQYADGEEKT